MVLALVLLPATAGLLGADAAGEATGTGEIARQIGLTLAKVAAFIALMFVVGRRLVPWLLSRVAGVGSRELFTLAVLATAFGIATGAAALFGVSFALGAFFAGMVLGESELSQRAGQDSLPLRDAFAVLFFVSVGMLFDPAVLLREPLHVAATVLIIIVGKSLAAYAIVRAFRYTHRAGLLIAASLAQIGEFSFILMNLGLELGLLPAEGRDLILAGAIISILLNPFVFALGARLAGRDRSARRGVDAPVVATESGHTVLIGHGRVGSHVAASLASTGAPLVVIEADLDRAQTLRDRGVTVVQGNAADSDVLRCANVAGARRLMVAIPNAMEAGEIVATARKENPSLRILARSHLDEASAHLTERGADRVFMGEEEIARRMVEDDDR